MERIAKQYRKNYPLLRLYKDDLQAIVTVILKYLQFLTIYAGDYIIESPTDLDNITEKEIHSLKVTAFKSMKSNSGKSKSNSFTLELTRTWAYLSISDGSDLELRGMITEIDLILSNRLVLRPFANIFYPFIPGVTSLFLTIIYSNISPKLAMYSALTKAANILTLFELSWVIATLYFIYGSHCVMYLSNSSVKSSFFQRNKDQILLSTVNTFIGIVVGLLVGYAIGWFGK